MTGFCRIGLSVLAILLLGVSSRAQVTISVDAGAPGTPYHTTWNWFGADEPNYLTTPAGRALLNELGHLNNGGPVYFRPHNLLTSGDGTSSLKWGSTGVYTEDAQGRPVYHWALTDGIFDAMLQAGVTPFVEIGFTPEALSPHPVPYRHNFPKGDIFTGWSYPPDNDAKWSSLIQAWVRHLRDRYGLQVARWRWEVWNEPDIAYFHGTPDQYFHLYDITAAAVQAALPGALVGGPAVTGPYGHNTFLRAFLEHCAHGRNAATGGTGAPLAFISFHPKGKPGLVRNRTGQPVPTPKSPSDSPAQAAPPGTHVQMGLYQQLAAIENGFRIVADFPQFRALPVILSESDPEGCAACTGPANDYRNGEAYSASVLEATARSEELAHRYGVNLEGAVNWAFLFPGQPPFAGFRELATAVPDAAHPLVDKPVLNAFRLLAALSGRRLAADRGDASAEQPSIAHNATAPVEQLPVKNTGAVAVEELTLPRPQTDVMALATRTDVNGKHELDILVWNYSDSLAPAPATPVTLTVTGLSRRVQATQTLLDHDHANAYTAWQSMGSPTNPTPQQVTKLLAAARLTATPLPLTISGTSTMPIKIERNGAALLRLTWH